MSSTPTTVTLISNNSIQYIYIYTWLCKSAGSKYLLLFFILEKGLSIPNVLPMLKTNVHSLKQSSMCPNIGNKLEHSHLVLKVLTFFLVPNIEPHDQWKKLSTLL